MSAPSEVRPTEGGSSAREEILAKVRAAIAVDAAVDAAIDAAIDAGAAHGPLSGPPSARQPVPGASYRRTGERSRGAVLELFAERVADYKAEVTRCTAGQLPGVIATTLTRLDVRRVVVPSGVPSPWLAAGGVEWLVDSGALTHAQLDQSDAVLSGCAVGIAVTGTFVMDGSATNGRRVATLLPDVHVCVVFADQVVETVPEALARLDPRRPLTFVSGPSATSDIELDRVEGVHGPRTLEVIVVSD